MNVEFSLSMNTKVAMLYSISGAVLIAAVFGSIPAGSIGKALAQNLTNQTTVNQTVVNQTTAQVANKTATNQTSASKLKLTVSDVQDIRKTLEDVRKDIADGKAVDALKIINEIDNKLLIAMSENPPPMLEKSTGSNK